MEIAVINLLFNIITFGMIGYIYFKLYKVKYFFNIVIYKLKKMNIDIDSIIEEIVCEPKEEKSKKLTGTKVDQPTIALYRQRLAECLSSGNSKTYLGKNITLEQLSTMSEKELIKCYTIYESKLGMNMTKSLGCSIISLYTAVVSHLFPIDSKEKLTEDLKNDPLITESLSSITSHLYFTYGSILAPLAATMITYCHIKKSPIKNSNPNIEIDNGTDRNTESNYPGTESSYPGIDSNCTATDSNYAGTDSNYAETDSK
jgi:hypothetical protein